jgi:hypothetical protein
MGKSQKFSTIEIITELASFAGCLNILALYSDCRAFCRFLFDLSAALTTFAQKHRMRARGAYDVERQNPF